MTDGQQSDGIAITIDKTVLSSRGIRTDLHQEGTSSLPKELRQLILDNMPDYEYLKSKTERYKRGEVDLAK